MAFEIQKAKPTDIYIAFLSDKDREAAKKNGLITDEDIKRVGPALTAEKKKEIFSGMTFLRILYFVSVASLGRTELELESKQKMLKQLNEWIGKLNNAMSYATELNAKADDKRMFFIWKDELKGLPDTLRAIKAEFGEDKIDIKLFFDRSEGGGMNTEKGISPNITIEKLRNICTTLDNVGKTNSTETQKINSVYNTILETISFVAKKDTDEVNKALSKIG